MSTIKKALELWSPVWLLRHTCLRSSWLLHNTTLAAREGHRWLYLHRAARFYASTSSDVFEY
eukprot:c56739_g1_i1 orf=3-185(-)